MEQKRAILQVRIQEEQKKEAERLYRAMGTSLCEAVRLFVAQSVSARKLPFQPVAVKACDGEAARGALSAYGDAARRDRERNAWISYLGTERELRDLNEKAFDGLDSLHALDDLAEAEEGDR